jgi:hypothetical protein
VSVSAHALGSCSSFSLQISTTVPLLVDDGDASWGISSMALSGNSSIISGLPIKLVHAPAIAKTGTVVFTSNIAPLSDATITVIGHSSITLSSGTTYQWLSGQTSLSIIVIANGNIPVIGAWLNITSISSNDLIFAMAIHPSVIITIMNPG